MVVVTRKNTMSKKAISAIEAVGISGGTRLPRFLITNSSPLVLAFGLPARYLNRYAEPDKESSSLSGSASDWPVPYWLTDAAFAAMALQLLAVEAGLGCCFFGLFEHEEAVRERFGVPDDAQAIGTVALGHPALIDGRASASTSRARRPLDEVLHRGTW